MGYTWIWQKIQKVQKTYTVKRCLSPLLPLPSFLQQRQPLENCFQFLIYPSRDSQCLYQHKCIYPQTDIDKHTHMVAYCASCSVSWFYYITIHLEDISILICTFSCTDLAGFLQLVPHDAQFQVIFYLWTSQMTQ